MGSQWPPNLLLLHGFVIVAGTPRLTSAPSLVNSLPGKISLVSHRSFGGRGFGERTHPGAGKFVAVRDSTRTGTDTSNTGIARFYSTNTSDVLVEESFELPFLERLLCLSDATALRGHEPVCQESFFSLNPYPNPPNPSLTASRLTASRLKKATAIARRLLDQPTSGRQPPPDALR